MSERNLSIQFEGWASESTIEGAIIKNVLLCGTESKNGYAIPPSAFGDLDKAQRLYENKLVYINHLRDPKTSAVLNRNLEDLGGYIKNVHLVNGKPRGDIHTEGTPKGNLTLQLAQNRVPNVGLSHVGLYKFNQSKELGNYVESVEEVFTVDVVSNPATTKSFFEQTQESNRMSEALERQLTTVQEEKNQLTVKYTKLEETSKNYETQLADLQKQLETAKQENTDLKAKVDEFETAKAIADRKVKIESELKAAQLNLEDTAEVSPTFFGILQSEKDEAKRAELIKDRVALVKKAKEAKGESHGSLERQEPTTEDWKPSKALESVSFV